MQLNQQAKREAVEQGTGIHIFGFLCPPSVDRLLHFLFLFVTSINDIYRLYEYALVFNSSVFSSTRGKHDDNYLQKLYILPCLSDRVYNKPSALPFAICCVRLCDNSQSIQCVYCSHFIISVNFTGFSRKPRLIVRYDLHILGGFFLRVG